MKDTKAAVVQAGSELFDTPKTLDKLADLTADATALGAQMVVFPEAFIGGYPKGHDFGARVGSRTPEGRDWFRRYYESAIDMSGPQFERLAQAAKKNACVLVVGVIERGGEDEATGTLYCSVLCFDADG
ncbi:MAG: nitrilase-related carbon-nitrogen hydrolase, partial [Pseudomonadota bacterium]